MKFKKITALSGVYLFLSSCNTLPTSGPTESQITSYQENSKRNIVSFDIVNLSTNLISVLNAPDVNFFPKEKSISSANDLIGAGDTLQITIYQSGIPLFSPQGGASVSASGSASQGPSQLFLEQQGGANSISLPPVVVDSKGFIKLPYLQPFKVNSFTANEISKKIKILYGNKIEGSDVVTTVLTNIHNTVSVYGDVLKPGRLPLLPQNENLFDLISLSGGAAHPLDDITFKIIRDGNQTEISYEDVLNKYKNNFYVYPNDRIEVEYTPRTYTVFGSTGKVQENAFSVKKLNLAEALARSGGLSDSQADPNAVYVFRYENSRIANGVLGSKFKDHPGLYPILYKIDMMNPSNYFIAQNFQIKSKDIIYVASAESNRLYKFLNMIGQITQPAITAGYMATRY